MQRTRLCWIVAVFVAALALAACSPIQPPVTVPEQRQSRRTAAAVEYDLGEATIIQERFPADSRFREMPVRLNGVIAAPAIQAGRAGRADPARHAPRLPGR
jgi:hypothetical protein